MRINHIAHSYPNFDFEIKNVHLKENQIIGLIGENGAGKTTLMTFLSELKEANIAFDVDGLDNGTILFIPSDLEPFDYMTVKEFVDIILKYTISQHSSKDIIQKLKLNGKEDVMISDLSQGMRKKLSLINVFVQNYKLIILDEPFNSVDVKYIYQLKQLLFELKEKSTILVSSHILSTLNDLCDEFIYLEDGHVKKCFRNTGKLELLERELFE